MSTPAQIARNNRARGQNGQKEIQKILLDFAGKRLEEDDIRNTSRGCGGEDLLLSPKARGYYPFSIEVKRRKDLSVMRFVEQAYDHTQKYPPLVFMREDKIGAKGKDAHPTQGQWYCCLSVKELLKLLSLAWASNRSLK